MVAIGTPRMGPRGQPLFAAPLPGFSFKRHGDGCRFTEGEQCKHGTLRIFGGETLLSGVRHDGARLDVHNPRWCQQTKAG